MSVIVLIALSDPSVSKILLRPVLPIPHLVKPTAPTLPTPRHYTFPAGPSCNPRCPGRIHSTPKYNFPVLLIVSHLVDKYNDVLENPTGSYGNLNLGKLYLETNLE